MKRMALAAAILAGCMSMTDVYQDGAYDGVGTGLRGAIRLRVWIEAGRIAEVELLEEQEDPMPGGAALEELIDTTLLEGVADLDTVSGATVTSEGFIAALKDALALAHGNSGE